MTANPLLIDGRITLQGAPGSPYTRKMLAILRYRQIPYRFLQWGTSDQLGWPAPRVSLLPTFYFPDNNGEPAPHTDSTPLLRLLESHYDTRRVVPPDPVMALLDRLIEDYADEWLTKPMFHYRWQYQADIDQSASTLPHWRFPAASDQTITRAGAEFASRQISRLGVVGSNETTGPIIEASYQRFVELMNKHLAAGQRFLLGGRPASCDFALYGQLTCLAQFDPTPMALTFKSGGRLYAWVSLLEDLSGESPTQSQWVGINVLPSTIRELLCEIGRTYVPVMLLNEVAVNTGAGTASGMVDGKPWTQKPFPYQAKCLTWLREAYLALESDQTGQFDALISGTGVELLFERSGK